MLHVADVDQLMLQLRDLVPGEAALRAREVERVDRPIGHRIAEAPVLEDLRLRVCVARGAVVAAVLVRPPPKLGFVTLQIQMREEQRVIRDLPERIFDSVLDQRSGGQRSMVSRSIVSAAWYWLFSTDRRVASAIDMALTLDRRRTEHPADLLVVTPHWLSNPGFQLA